MNIESRIIKIRKTIEEHNHNYYVLDNPIISDGEYDLLLRELESLESKNPQLIVSVSPTQRVGSSPISEFKKGNLLSAAHHLNNFANTYRSNIKAEECAYLSVYCYYLLSPKYSLDQINTYKALDEAAIFIDTYPLSSYYNDCLNLVDKLKLKLDRKSFESAKLYYTTQNYKSAIHAFNFTLQDNPNSSFTEEILFLQLKSYYFLAKNSVEEKKDKRIKDTIFAFNQFKNTYPNSQYLNESKLIHKQVKLLRE